jgi:crotonobetainyl-CoA:carnitine CoA-transferase CaiB-like acyl-CoA transferase
VQYRRAPPTLGQHTAEVLATWLGIGAEGMAALREKKIV